MWLTSDLEEPGAPERLALSEVLARTDEVLAAGGAAATAPCPTGFPLLDTVLSGGLRDGELSLLAGAQGLGKTTFALQVARYAAGTGRHVLYVSYEHDAINVLERLAAADVGEREGLDGRTLADVRRMLEGNGPTGTLTAALSSSPEGPEGVTALVAALSRVHVVRGRFGTDAAAVALAAAQLAGEVGASPLVVVDYVQKVSDLASDEESRMAHVAGALKDLALTLEAPVLAITASDAVGIESGSRLRTHHFRGASALAYEADVILVLNEKYDVVARHHLMYGGTNVDRLRNYAVLTVEKNRGGASHVDIQLRKRFEQARYERDGQHVAEKLVDERMYVG